MFCHSDNLYADIKSTETYAAVLLRLFGKVLVMRDLGLEFHLQNLFVRSQA